MVYQFISVDLIGVVRYDGDARVAASVRNTSFYASEVVFPVLVTPHKRETLKTNNKKLKNRVYQISKFVDIFSFWFIIAVFGYIVTMMQP